MISNISRMRVLIVVALSACLSAASAAAVDTKKAFNGGGHLRATVAKSSDDTLAATTATRRLKSKEEEKKEFEKLKQETWNESGLVWNKKSKQFEPPKYTEGKVWNKEKKKWGSPNESDNSAVDNSNTVNWNDQKEKAMEETKQEDDNSNNNNNVEADVSTSVDADKKEDEWKQDDNQEATSDEPEERQEQPSGAVIGDNAPTKAGEEKQDQSSEKGGSNEQSEAVATVAVPLPGFMENATETEVEPTTSKIASALPNITFPNVTFPNMTAMSLSACEQIEMAVSFLTSLDYNQNFEQVFTVEPNPSTEKRTLFDVYLLQIIVTPLSLAMAFYGSKLLLTTCCLTAAGLGVFLVFHFLEQLSESQSKYAAFFEVDCQMKLALGVVSGCLSVMLAHFFVRFGLFTLGALAAGGGSYLVLDAFPFLDPTSDMWIDAAVAVGVNETMATNMTSYETVIHSLHNGEGTSELSTFGWIVTVFVGVCGGLLLRWYEQASLEIVTAVMGGLGSAYSLHTFVILQGGELDRAIVFLVAYFVAYAGWKYQRSRRLRFVEYAHKKTEQAYSPVATSEPSVTPAAAGPPPANWEQLQASINQLAAKSGPQQPAQASPSAEQIAELTNSIQSLIKRMGEPSSPAAPQAATNSEGGDKQS